MNAFRIAAKGIAASLGAALIAAPAFAHNLPDGHHGFGHGVAHMFGGADHIAIAILVGVWASASPGRRGLAVLGAYGAALLGAGLLGVALPGAAIDGLLLALIFAAGGMILLAREGWTGRVASVLVIAMAAVQGFAHVADIGASGGNIAANAPFVAGLAVTTVGAAGAASLLALAARRRMARIRHR